MHCGKSSNFPSLITGHKHHRLCACRSPPPHVSSDGNTSSWSLELSGSGAGFVRHSSCRTSESTEGFKLCLAQASGCSTGVGIQISHRADHKAYKGNTTTYSFQIASQAHLARANTEPCTGTRMPEQGGGGRASEMSQDKVKGKPGGARLSRPRLGFLLLRSRLQSTPRLQELVPLPRLGWRCPVHIIRAGGMNQLSGWSQVRV